MQYIRMCKKLLLILMCMCVLVAGCSKKPSAVKLLDSMTIGQVRQLVLDWGYGKLPEQQVEGADEIRKELEILEDQLAEQEAKDSKQLDILWVQIGKQKADRENQVDILRKQYEAEAAESLKQLQLMEEKKIEAFREYSKIAGLWKGTNKEERRWAVIKRKYEVAAKAWKSQLDLQPQYWPVNYNKILNPRRKQCKEQWQEAVEKHSSLKAQLKLQRVEFHEKKIASLKEHLKADNSVETFYKVFGKPKNKSLIGNDYYFQYRCKDGIGVLEINAHYFDNDKVLIQTVSVL